MRPAFPVTLGLLTVLLLAPAAANARVADTGDGALAAAASAGRVPPVPALGDRVPPASASAERDGDRVRVRPPARARGATIARVVAPTFARRRLARPRPRRLVGTQTAWSAQSQVLLVLASRLRAGRRWLRVLLADRPNRSAGWIPRDRVTLGRTGYWIDVHRRRRVIVVYRDRKLVRRFRAVVGAPGTPTPLGLAAIYERNRQPDPRAFLGPWVLSLTSHSNVLENFGGGPGRVGIHGRSGASLQDPLGSARSHGCIRVDNRHIRWMAARVPAGTPVRVRR